jgi:autotransporter-associated beta strand protein
MKNKNLFFLLVLFVTFCIEGMAQRQLENLDRGIVAVRTNTSNVFLSWRLLGDDADSTAFNIYCNNILVNAEPITGATNYNHNTTVDGAYYIRPVIHGIEQPQSESVPVWGQNYLNVPLQRPPGGTTPPYTVTNNHVVESYPDGQDYTYSPNDCSIGDIDGDGEYEIIVKWDPSNSRDNSYGGITGNVFIDAYKLDGTQLWRIDLGINIRAGAHYTQFLVYDFDGDGKSEIAFKTAPGTKDGTSSYLSLGPAASDDDLADYRGSDGRVLSGPEYLSVFNGETGKEMATVNYNPPRGKVCDWGDCYGNRVDRFLATVAYLDGVHPSLVMCRGYYTRTVLAAWDWDGSVLSPRWVFDSDKGYPGYAGQGNHNLSVADVDQDGKDEIIYGACTINNNGKGLYSTGFGHGDAIHVSDLDPDRPGLEVFTPHENKKDGITFREAKTGKIIWQKKDPTDVGRALAADVISGSPGCEFWAAHSLGMYSVSGQKIGSIPPINFAIWWDADDTRELLDGIQITKYGAGTLLYATGCSSNNSTKSTPNLQADIFGDWREEVILRTTDNSNLHIFTPTSLTTRKIYTLMHDPVYRLGIAWQNTGYNQPPHTGFHLGYGMQTPPPSPMKNNKAIWVSGTTWDINSSQNWQINNNDTVYHDGDNVLFDLTGSNVNLVNITGTIAPASVFVNSPNDYTFTGTGKLTGPMSLKKNGSGSLTLENKNDFNGPSQIWGGILYVEKGLSASPVEVYKFASVFAAGDMLSVTLHKHATLENGSSVNTADSLKIQGDLNLGNGSVTVFDLSSDTSGLTLSNDFISIGGDIHISGRPVISVSMLNDSLSQGTYKLMECTGNISGSPDSLILQHMEGIPYELFSTANTIFLKIFHRRNPGQISWKGGKNNNAWDLTFTKNFMLTDKEVVFVEGDTVSFSDNGYPNSTIDLTAELNPSLVEFNHTVPYLLKGEGTIGGTTDLIKSGTGKLTISASNSYSGKTIINGGTIEIPSLSNAGIPGTLGASDNTDTSLIFNGGSLMLTNTSSSTNRNFYLTNNGGSIHIGTTKTFTYNGQLHGAGCLTKTGSGRLIIKEPNFHSGGIKISGGEVNLATEDAITNGMGSGPVTIESGTLSMLDNASASNAPWDIIVPNSATATIKLDQSCQYNGSLTGDGTLNLYSPGNKSELLGDWADFSGNINVTTDEDGGWLILGNKKGYGKSYLNLNGPVAAQYRFSSNDTIELGELTGTIDSRLGAGGDGNNTITWKMGTLGTSFTFDGKITEIQYAETGAVTSIIKTGIGNMILTNNNEYTGGTYVEQGILTINNTTGSGTGNGPVIVGPGATLSGTGYIEGNTSIKSKGVLSPGNNSIGTLTLNNNLTFQPGSYFQVDLTSNDLQSDLLVVDDTLFMDGMLYLSIIGDKKLEAGDSIKIVQCNKCTGNFSSITPLFPARNLIWDTSSIRRDGYLRVKKEEEPPILNDSPLELQFKVYPNPCNNQLYIESPTLAENACLQITTLSGKTIFCNKIYHNKPINTYDISNIKNGIYLITIILENKKLMKKLIIQY